MAGYDFENLSHHDFEIVVQDVLQAELGVRLESFTAGRDTGINLRYALVRDEPDIIIQAKHYAKSGFNKLKGDLGRTELPKILRLAPRRYLLATSVPLTRKRKADLLELLTPYVISTADIVGAEDINDMLRRHPEIERSHFKLWLTSTEVLQTVLQHAIYMRSLSLQEGLVHKARVYVPNRSFSLADHLLNTHHVCIIAGVPSIGKGLLAEMLLVAYIHRGYEPVLISEDISEGSAVFSSGPQIFYYDDFLGQTSSSEKLAKNEDARLLAFMNQIASSSNKRLILTTREYILRRAAQRYERLDRVSSSFHRVVINLEDYTRLERAQILYNHLYFSSLPDEALHGIVDGQFYKTIIRHPNYNPRLIEAMTALAGEETRSGHRFAEFFLQTLENPELVWSHAFENQLPSEAQTVLFLLATMPADVLVESIWAAFREFHPARTGGAARRNSYRQALKRWRGTSSRLSGSEGSMRLIS